MLSGPTGPGPNEPWSGVDLHHVEACAGSDVSGRGRTRWEARRSVGRLLQEFG